MRFESRSFWIAKDTEMPQCYEDAFCLDVDRGAAAIAGGVSEGIFSVQRARILTQTTVAEPPNLEDPVEFQAWLARQRAAWAAQIDTSRLAWYQRPKMIDGGMSTLLWLALSPNNGQPDAVTGSYCLEGFAIGDCCLFHVRHGKQLRSFPVQSAADFDLTPGMIGSVDQKRDHLLEFQAIADVCLPGDLLALCTDALAQWALARSEAGEPVNWEDYWTTPVESWQEEIIALRGDRQLRYDDTTLLLLRVVEETVAPESTQGDGGGCRQGLGETQNTPSTTSSVPLTPVEAAEEQET
jgi:hypothetical protein